MTYHESLLRRFLLGELEEPARSRLELEVLEDDSLFEHIESIEGEMLLDLSRGELPETQASALEARIPASDEGRREWEFHHLLGGWLRSQRRERNRTASKEGRASTSGTIDGPWQIRVVSGLVAALLTLAVALPVFKASQSALEAENESLATQVAEARAAESSAPLRATFFLSPLTRSSDRAESFRVGRQTEFIELWLEPPYGSGPFRVEVRQGGKRLLRRETAPIERDWGAVVPVELEAHTLSSGPLEVILERFAGGWSAVASYSVDLEKRWSDYPPAK